jgi:hypothetical protein
VALIEGESVDSLDTTGDATGDAKGAPCPNRGAKPKGSERGPQALQRDAEPWWKNRCAGPGGQVLLRPVRARETSGDALLPRQHLLHAPHLPPTPGPLGRTAGPATAGGPGLAFGVEKLALPLGRAGSGLRKAGSVAAGGGEGAPAGAPGWSRQRVIEGPAAAPSGPGLGLLAGGT